MTDNPTRRGVLAGAAALLAGCGTKAPASGDGEDETAELSETVDRNLEDTETESTPDTQSEQSIEDTLGLIEHSLEKQGYGPVDGEELVENDDGTVSIRLDMEEVYDNIGVLEDFDRQNVRYIDESGQMDRFIEDISVPVTGVFMKAAQELEKHNDEYSYLNLDIVGADQTSLGLTISAEDANRFSRAMEDDRESNKAPSVRMANILDEEAGFGANAERSEAVFYVPEGQSHTVTVNGEETQFKVDGAFSNEQEARVDVDIGEENDNYFHDRDTVYKLAEGVYLQIDEINPLNDRYGQGVAFRVGLGEESDHEEFALEEGEKTIREYGSSEDNLEYVSVPEQGKAVVRANGETVELEEGEFYKTESALYRLDQAFQKDSLDKGFVEIEAIYSN